MKSMNISPSLYQRAIDWIASNDEALETDLKAISDQITVLLVADLWSKDPVAVAKAVKARRAREKQAFTKA